MLKVPNFLKRDRNQWPKQKPRNGEITVVNVEGDWVNATYDNGKDWPAPVWHLPDTKYMGCDYVACRIFPQWRRIQARTASRIFRPRFHVQKLE